MAALAFLTDATVPLLYLEPKHLTSSFAATHGLNSRGLKRCRQQLQSVSMLQDVKRCRALLSCGASTAQDGYPKHVLVEEAEEFESKYKLSIKEEPLHFYETESVDDAKVFEETEVVSAGSSSFSAEMLSACFPVLIVEDEPCTCNHCEYCTNQKSKCLSHGLILENFGEDLYYMCKQCRFRTKYRGKFEIHLLIHKSKSDKPFACFHCSYITDFKYNLRIHHRVHERDRVKPFACNQCKYSADKKRSMERHLSKHQSNRIKPFVCNHCSFGTDLENNFKRHLRIHDSDRDKPFACSHCRYRTDNKGHLKIHLSIHERIKMN